MPARTSLKNTHLRSRFSRDVRTVTAPPFSRRENGFDPGAFTRLFALSGSANSQAALPLFDIKFVSRPLGEGAAHTMHMAQEDVI